MKTVKKGSVLLIAMLLSLSFAYAQTEQPTMFVVHTDNVKFNMLQQYEEVAKQMHDAFTDHKSDAMYTTISIEDGRYVYVSPIKSMADLDNHPVAELVSKMGEEKATKMFNKMDECYDSHTDYVIHHSSDLSYMPEGYTTTDKNYREYHFLYYSPKNAKAMKKAMEDVKNMFKEKGIKNGYNVYHSGFGTEETYYMVEVAGEDSASIAMGGKEDDKIMGEDGNAAMFGVISLATKYDQVNGNIRPDLSYYPTEN